MCHHGDIFSCAGIVLHSLSFTAHSWEMSNGHPVLLKMLARELTFEHFTLDNGSSSGKSSNDLDAVSYTEGNAEVIH